jgi:hypothetical protein
MSRKTISWVIKIAGTVLILAFLFSRIRFSTSEFLKVISSLDPWYFLLSLCGVVIILAVKSYRWKILLQGEGIDYHPFKAFSAYLASFTIGIVTPGRIGEIARLYYVREDSPVDFYEAFKTVVADRIFDLTTLFVLGTSGVLFYVKALGDLPGYMYGLIVFLTFVLLYAIAWFVINGLLKTKTFGRYHILKFIRDTWFLVINKKSLKCWIITVMAYLVYFVTAGWIFEALKINFSLIEVAFILSIMSLVTIIPISVAGFGTREASLVILLAQYGISTESALSFSLLQFLAFFLWGAIIGTIFWILKPVSLKLVKEDSLRIWKLIIGFDRAG